VDEWLNSTDVNKGKALFQEVSSKIMTELSAIVAQRRTTRRRRRLLVKAYYDALIRKHTKQLARPRLRRAQRRLGEVPAQEVQNNATTFLEQADAEHEAETYHGADDASDRIMVYLASDNERVKEAFAEFLMEHHNVSVARVRTGDIIVHAKNRGVRIFDWLAAFYHALVDAFALCCGSSLYLPPIVFLAEYLKNTQDGVLALAVDWYSLSLANALFVWRRDLSMTSTFVRVSASCTKLFCHSW
jgi:hypothetical protein